MSEPDYAAAIRTLKELHPRPRIGQRVKLRKNGRIAEVLVVRKAREVIKLKNEVQALMMGSRLQASFGSFWIEVYYEADVIIGDVMFTVNTTEVAEVLESA